MALQNNYECYNSYESDDGEYVFDFRCNKEGHEWWKVYAGVGSTGSCPACKVIYKNNKAVAKATENGYKIIGLTKNSALTDTVEILCKNNHSRIIKVISTHSLTYNCEKCNQNEKRNKFVKDKAEENNLTIIGLKNNSEPGDVIKVTCLNGYSFEIEIKKMYTSDCKCKCKNCKAIKVTNSSVRKPQNISYDLLLKKIKKAAIKGECECFNSYISDDGKYVFEFKCNEKGHEWWKVYEGSGASIFCPICNIIKKNIKSLTEAKENGYKMIGLTKDSKLGDNVEVSCKNNHSRNLKVINVHNFNYNCEKCNSNKIKNKAIEKSAEENNYTIIGLTSNSDPNDVITVSCENDHSFEIDIKGMYKFNYKCKNCKSDSIINEAKQIAKQRAGLCLSNIYEGYDVKLKWSCYYGHEFTATFTKVKDGVWCSSCHIYIGESISRKILETLFDVEFIKVRPKWLKEFELDGYCENVIVNDKTFKIAFEYQGRQHYEYIECWNETTEDFEKRKERDKEKVIMCKENNVVLIVIPYTIKLKDLQNFIMDACFENDVKVDYNEVIDINKFTDIYKYNDSRFDEMIKIITNKGGKTYAKVYVSSRHMIEVTCLEDGYTWTTCYDYLKQGLWCPECSGHKKHTLEEFQQIAIRNNGECLSLKYENMSKKLCFRCCEGHEFETRADHVLNGGWCPECNGKKRHTIKDFQTIADRKNGECLSIKYKATEKIEFICEKGHSFYMLGSNVIRGRWCPTCAKTNRYIK